MKAPDCVADLKNRHRISGVIVSGNGSVAKLAETQQI